MWKVVAPCVAGGSRWSLGLFVFRFFPYQGYGRSLRPSLTGWRQPFRLRSGLRHLQ
jgi:hypothetical protein